MTRGSPKPGAPSVWGRDVQGAGRLGRGQRRAACGNSRAVGRCLPEGRMEESGAWAGALQGRGQPGEDTLAPGVRA